MRSFIIILLSLSYLYCQNIYVSTTGSDDNDGSEENPFATIQNGINAASDGDIVLVEAGTYLENIYWPETNGISLISSGDSSNTIINGGGNSMVIYMNPTGATIDSSTIISGFKITNGGNTNNGGGIFIKNAGPKLESISIINNSANSNGGGLYIEDADPVIVNSNIANNSSNSGGGVYVKSNITSMIRNTKIHHNQTTGGYPDGGGGIRAGGYYGYNTIAPELTNVDLYNNDANKGAAIFYSNVTGSINNVKIHDHNTIDGNSIFSIHGPSWTGNVLINDLYLYDNISPSTYHLFDIESSHPIINGCFIYNNDLEGDLISLSQRSLSTINNIIFTDNSSTDVLNISGSNTSPLLENVIIAGNLGRALNSNGGNNYSLLFSNALIKNNSGGAGIINNGSVSLSNLSVIENGELSEDDAEGFTITESGILSLTESNIFNNGTALHNNNTSEILSAVNNYWGHLSGPYHPTMNISGQGDSTNFFTDVDPWLSEPNIDAPISPPTNVFKQVSGNDIALEWDANLENDLAGYKVHYGDYTGYSYETNLDVGNVTSYTLPGVNISTDIFVTAYDNDIDGTNDQTEGHQSWFTQSYVTGCTDPTAINYDSYATINDGSCYHDILTDIDGNEYKAIQIGEQLWMKENLKVTHYNNGEPILTGFNNSEWANLSNVQLGAYAVYGDDPSNAEVYGNLYNDFAVVDNRGLAPDGWKIPTANDFTELINYLGGTSVAANKLMEQGTTHWNTNPGATNESGFTALPAGLRRDHDGNYMYLGTVSQMRSTTDRLEIGQAMPDWIGLTSRASAQGMSIRLIKKNIVTWHVSTSGSNNNDGSEGSPLSTIQAGIDSARSGDTVQVMSGTYFENINFNGKNIVLRGENRQTTIIDGNSNGSVVTFGLNNDGDVSIDSTALFTKFTVQNGSGTSQGGSDYDGGGIYCYWASPSLKDLIIKNNQVTNSGGGIKIKNARPLLVDLIINNNEAGGNGGGISIDDCDQISLKYSLLTNNYSFGSGSAIFNSSSNLTIINVTAYGNSSSGNETNNSAFFSYGNGITTNVINSIFWNENSSGELAGSAGASATSFLNISYSNILGSTTALQNFTISYNSEELSFDPLFIDVENNDFNLNLNSPCIDAGNPDMDGDGQDYNTDPDDRDPDGSRMDIGALYFHQNDIPPYPPQNLTARAGGNNEIILTWMQNDETDFASYLIYGGVNANPTMIMGSTTIIDDTTETISELTNGIEYFFRIKAVDGSGNESIYSNEVNAIPIYQGPIWYVSNDGTNDNQGSEDHPLATIQHGINKSSDGDTILVQAGTYVENINYNGKNIVVQGEDSETTIIDGNQNGTVVRFSGGETSSAVLKNLSIINGQTASSAGAGGINCSNNSNPILSHLNIYNNEGINAGGVMINGGSAPLIEHTLIHQNSSNWGGGLWLEGPATLSNVTVTNNIAEYGAGFHSYNSGATIINSIIWGNHYEQVNIYGSISITYSLLPDEGTGNIDVDPRFIDIINADYHLQWNSPCIDAGDPASSLDLDGTIADMGAFYFDQSSVDNVTVTPDSLDFGLEEDTLSFIIRYVGINDLSWDIQGSPDWLSFIPLESESRQHVQDINPHMEVQNNGPDDTKIIDHLNTNTRSTVETVSVIIDRDQCDAGINEGHFTVSSNHGDNIIFVSAEKLYTGPIWYVSTEGNDFDGNGSQELPFKHIQYAVDIASNGDTIMISSGLYEENISVIDKNLTFIGSTINPPIISPQNSATENFQTLGGDSLNIENISFYGNGAIVGIYIANTISSKFKNVIISGYDQCNGFGLQILDINFPSTQKIKIENSIIKNNCNGINNYSADLEVISSVIDSNSTGIFFTADEMSLSLFDVIFSNNKIIESSDHNSGSGIKHQSSYGEIFIDSCQFFGNDGGAIHLNQSFYGETNILNTQFFNNHSDNDAAAISGIYNGNISGCMFRYNNSHNPNYYGSVLRLRDEGEVFVNNSIFISNGKYGQDELFGRSLVSNDTWLHVNNSIIWNFKKLLSDELDNFILNINYSCVQGGYQGTGNISQNPLFCNPYSLDLSLSENSPCLSNGYNNFNMGNLEVGCIETNSILYVNDDGSENGTGEAFEPINSIDVALNTIFDNDSIIVAEGTYFVENGISNPPPVFLIGQGNDETIIEYDTYMNQWPIINLDGEYSESIHFEDLSLKMQNETQNGSTGINIYNDAYVQFINCKFEGFGNYDRLFQIYGGEINTINCLFNVETDYIYNNSSGDLELIHLNNPQVVQSDFFIDGLDSLFVYGMDADSIDIIFDDINYLKLKNSNLSNSPNAYLSASLSEYENNIFDSNILSLTGNHLEIKYCQFSGNTTSGHIIYGVNYVGIDHCTFFGNNDDNYANNIIRVDGCEGSLSNTIIQEDNTILQFGTCNDNLFSALYSVVDFSIGSNGSWGENGINQNNIIYSNPLFVDPIAGDFHLLWGSPAIDSGDPNSPLDPDGTITDVGAYYYDQTDLEAPTVDLNDITNDLGTADELVITWSAYDNYDLGLAEIYYSIDSLETILAVDTVDAELGQYTFPIPDSLLTNYSAFIIYVYDEAGNSAIDTSNFFSIYDNTPPNVDVISPQEDFSVPENETFWVEWTHSDNIELFGHIFEHTTDGLSFDTLLNTNDLIDANTYEFQLAGVTNTAQIRITILDAAGNYSTDISEQFSVTDNTPPIIDFTSPLFGTTVGIGDQFELTWNDSDNVGVEIVSLYYNVGDIWNSIAENIINTNVYNWLVPNEPTENLHLRLIGKDAIGLSDTSEVDGLTIEISYPMVQSIIPEPGNIDFRTNEFHFTLSQPLDASTITSDNILVTSLFTPDLQPLLSYVDTSQSIKISFDNNIVSMDSISVTLTEQLTNVYGYGLDGDSDGEGGDSYMATYNTSMLADYNGDMTITIEDLSQFIINWEDNNLTEELGPFVGEIPRVYISPDGDYNYHDMGAFALMWNWYFSNNTILFASYEDEGLPIQIETEHDTIYLDIPTNLSAYQVQIQYNPGSFFIGSLDDKDGLILAHQEQELGIYTIMAEPGQKQLAIPIEIGGRDANISISYKGISSQGELAGQMTKSMTIENVPDEFVLFANYPNPFNPITKIDYGLPEEANVSLVIFDILGREVITLANGLQEPGYRSMTWNGTDAFGRNVSAGMYFYLLQAGDFRKVNKMILLK